MPKLKKNGIFWYLVFENEDQAEEYAYKHNLFAEHCILASFGGYFNAISFPYELI